MNRLLRVFLNTHMGLGHVGLCLLASKNQVRLDALKNGEHVAFVNRQRNKVKVYSSGDVLHYIRLPQGEKLRMEAIQWIPSCFGAKGFKYPQALANSFGSFMDMSVKETNSMSFLKG